MVPGICLTLVGIVNTTYKPSSDVTVIAPVVVGLVLIAAFRVWRESTAPLIVAFIITMFYNSVNVICPTMVNVFYLGPDVVRSTELLLTLPPNVGLVFGSLCLMALAQYESIEFTQLGVPQQDLGFLGGLAGMARYAGGSLAQAVYTTILTNTQTTHAAATLPAAAVRAGTLLTNAQALFAAFPLGAAAIAEVPGTTAGALGIASLAYQWSYAHALRIVVLSSLSFGIVELLCILYCEDLTPKTTDKVKVFLGNDVYADKNEFH
ncbi:hypothetical protein G6011_04395 [Alternaria panax]|uniref:Uncharacterized protein n=1 Tax=Alternaria panax TaxID=48097 RepID=A0AAD4IH36_9PLEO|nr:hypothetical protein G6011_04395 [Alternaria panax]